MSAPLYVETPDEPLRAAMEAPLRGSRDRGGWEPAAVDPLRERSTHAFANASRNGRVGRALPDGHWIARFARPLPAEVSPRYLVTDGSSRVAAIGRRHAAIADLGGALVATVNFDPLEPVLDADRGALWSAGLSGLLQAHALDDGAPRWTELARGAAGMERSLSLTPDGALRVLTRETRWQPHSGELPRFTSLELRDLGAPLAADAEGFITSSTRRAAICRDAERFVFAAGAEGEHIVAVEHRLWWLDARLGALSCVIGEFIPLFLSGDEASRAYLIAQTAEGIALKVVTADGRVLLDAVIPDALGDVIAPPVVSHRHRVHVLCAGGMFSVGPADLDPWSDPALPDAPRAATVTGDDHLLLSVGDGVAMVSPQGRLLRHHRLGGPALVTAPVLTLRGEILVASAEALHAIEPL